MAAGLWAALACAAPARADAPLAAYVILGDGGLAVARVITDAPSCPRISVDGRSRPMTLRAPAETEPQRPTASSPENSKPSAFPALTCEARLPHGAQAVSVQGRRLPLPRATARRIVVIGDTGCRLKESDHAWQACNDPAKYPFATVAAKAAAWKPDLVVHVGDLLYRENPCPAGNAGCAGSPWGYGLDAWRADFFEQGAPLLRAAPWVMTRGNHEICSRAGQGWRRFIDPRPLAAGRDCNDPAKDADGDYSAPYAVPLGGGAQIVVMDLSAAGAKPIPDSDPRAAQYRETFARLDALSRQATFTFALDHYPILGVAAEDKKGPVTIKPGNPALQSIFGPLNRRMAPAGVDVLLAGHVHLWEQVSFSSAHPSQFITGFSGTEEDVVPIPAHLPSDVAPAPGARIDQFSSWVDGFGYMTLERQGPRAWKVTVWNTRGEAVNRCAIQGRRSRCDRPQVTPSSANPPPV
ncbi:MAG TPA: metallophosphoesterase [Phenylobacterium sp.]|jgi:hypothetical protein|nr:metallophosphoesterase [Phenylobacterium sp.]